MRKVEATISIKTDPSRIIAAFTDAEMLRAWWSVERSLIEKKAGGIYLLAWAISSNGFGYVSSGIISDYHPGERLVIDNYTYLNPSRPFFGPMSLSIEVKSENGESHVYLCQDGYGNGPDWDWYYDAVNNAWPEVLVTLKTFLGKQD